MPDAEVISAQKKTIIICALVPEFRNLNTQKFSPSKLIQNVWVTYPYFQTKWKEINAVKNKLESLDGEQKFLKAINGKRMPSFSLPWSRDT